VVYGSLVQADLGGGITIMVWRWCCPAGTLGKKSFLILCRCRQWWPFLFALFPLRGVVVVSLATVGGSSGENLILACQMRRWRRLWCCFFLERHLGGPSVCLCYLSGIRQFEHQVSKTLDVMVCCCIRLRKNETWTKKIEELSLLVFFFFVLEFLSYVIEILIWGIESRVNSCNSLAVYIHMWI